MSVSGISVAGALPTVDNPINIQRPNSPSFLDVFSSIFNDAVVTNEIQQADRIRLMLGEVDDIAEVQLNMRKAEFATDLLVTVRNTVLDSYNEIIRMQI